MLQIAIVVREILFTMFGLTVSIFFSRKYAQIIWINTTNVVYKQYRNVDNLLLSKLNLAVSSKSGPEKNMLIMTYVGSLFYMFSKVILYATLVTFSTSISMYLGHLFFVSKKC